MNMFVANLSPQYQLAVSRSACTRMPMQVAPSSSLAALGWHLLLLRRRRPTRHSVTRLPRQPIAVSEVLE